MGANGSSTRTASNAVPSTSPDGAVRSYSFMPKYTQTMTRARCVGSENPAISAYTRAASMAPGAAALMGGTLPKGPGVNAGSMPQVFSTSR